MNTMLTALKPLGCACILASLAALSSTANAMSWDEVNEKAERYLHDEVGASNFQQVMSMARTVDDLRDKRKTRIFNMSEQQLRDTFLAQARLGVMLDVIEEIKSKQLAAGADLLKAVDQQIGVALRNTANLPWSASIESTIRTLADTGRGKMEAMELLFALERNLAERHVDLAALSEGVKQELTMETGVLETASEDRRRYHNAIQAAPDLGTDDSAIRAVPAHQYNATVFDVSGKVAKIDLTLTGPTGEVVLERSTHHLYAPVWLPRARTGDDFFYADVTITCEDGRKDAFERTMVSDTHPKAITLNHICG